jgi:hypothetical protein
MNTYITTSEGAAAIRAPRSAVAALPQVTAGKWAIIPATAALRAAARRGAIRTGRIIAGRLVGSL